MAIPELLESLLRAPGPSGYEEPASAVWREAAQAYGEVGTDALGSSWVRLGGGDGPTVAVMGHIDEIGMIVTHIGDDGFLAVRRIGGWNAEVIVGQRVDVLTRKGPIRGVAARRRAATHGSDEKPSRAEIDQIHVDVGAKDGEEARALVRPGDAAIFVGEPIELPNRRLVSRALDNRVGSFVVLEILRLLAEGDAPPGDVVGVVSTLEENGGAGARSVVYGLEPDAAIVFDVTSATDVPGADPKDDGEHKLGSGPAILRAPSLSPKLFELLYETAEAEGIDFTVEVAGRATYTDADVVHLTRSGIPTAVVSVPLRYMHSPIELVQLDDVEATARLVAATARRLEQGTSFTR